jgi:hypothetical protein
MGLDGVMVGSVDEVMMGSAVSRIVTKVGYHSSNRTMHLSGSPSFVVEVLIIPSFPEKP